jgi:TolA-binding protein
MQQEMRVKNLLYAVAFMACLSTPVHAEDPPPAGNAPTSPAQEDQSGRQQLREQRFSDRKTEKLKMLGDRISEEQARIAEMERKQNCVQAAATPEALEACFPNAGKYGQGESTGWQEHRKEWREFHEGWKRKHGSGDAKTPSDNSATPAAAPSP